MGTPEVDEPRVRSRGGRRIHGRKDENKQEGVTVPEKVKEGIDELVTLYRAQHTAAEDFSAAVKAVAEKSNYNAAAVRKFVVARAGEKFAEAKRLSEQQMELFDEVGE